MEFCKYCNIAPYNSYCTCQINGDICPYVRRCIVEQCYLPNKMDKCLLRKESTALNDNEYKVRFCLHGVLYVEMGNSIMQIKNPYDYIPEKVTLYKGENGYSFTKYRKSTKKKVETEVEVPVVEEEVVTEEE